MATGLLVGGRGGVGVGAGLIAFGGGGLELTAYLIACGARRPRGGQRGGMFVDQLLEPAA